MLDRTMRYPRYLIPLILIAILIILMDQIWKFMVLEILVYGDPVQVINNFFSLNLAFNPGAAFGILPGRQVLFLILPVFTVILISVLYLRSDTRAHLMLPLGLLLGGIIGNFIDRIRFGCVIDFFDFYWRTFHWPAFNFADTYICAGVILVVWQMMRK